MCFNQLYKMHKPCVVFLILCLLSFDSCLKNVQNRIEPLETIFGADFRKSKRFKGKSTVKLEIPSSEHLFYAQMKDFSRDGMCVETSTSIRPGTKINIKLDRPLFTSSRKNYNTITIAVNI